MFMMKELNAIWRDKFGRDLTEEEAWKMVDFVNLVLENADRNFDSVVDAENETEKEVV